MTFVYRINDTASVPGATASATVTLIIPNVNTPQGGNPTANPDAYTVTPGATLVVPAGPKSVIANDVTPNAAGGWPGPVRRAARLVEAETSGTGAIAC